LNFINTSVSEIFSIVGIGSLRTFSFAIISFNSFSSSFEVSRVILIALFQILSFETLFSSICFGALPFLNPGISMFAETDVLALPIISAHSLPFISSSNTIYPFSFFLVLIIAFSL
jgi:hypothetical protein